MAIADEKDFTHIARTTTQWENARDKYEIIPEGVLCVEFSPSNITKIKIGDGHKYFSQLPYIGNGDLNNYYTKRETDDRVLQIMLDNCSVRIKGELDSETKLPTHAACGDVWFVKSTTESDPKNRYIEYIYSHEHKWEIIGGTPIDIDLSGYAKKEYVDEKINVVNKKIDSFDHHTHDNKIVLDQITAFFTSEEKLKLKELHNYDDTALRELIEQATHNHPNKVILDKITAAYTVADKSKLDGLSNYDDTLLIAKITALEELAHEHLNKTILDNTTASFTKEYEKKLKWIRVYTGATDNEDGIMGMVPPAPAGDQDYVLNGAGEWVPMQGGSGPIDPATKTKTGVVKIGDGISVKADGTISILPPDEEQIGGITPGVGLTTDQFGKLDIIYGEGLGIDDDGKLYATGEKEEPFRYHPGNAITFDIEDPEEKDHDITINATIATDEECGVVIIGDGLSITEDGIVSVKIGNGLSLDEETGEINVDIATYETPGIVKPGKGLTISEDGTLDVTVQAPDNYHPGKGVYFTTVDETYHGVTYIETDGIDKVIDTDVLPAPDMEMYIQFSFIDPTPNTYISGVDNDTNGGFTVGTNDGITLITNDVITTPDDIISPNKIMESSINLTSEHVLSDTIPLFARSMNGTYDGFSKMRLYSAFIISNNEVAKAGLVPVVRDSDNKPGLFNLATGDFLTNAIPGGGDFIAGDLTDKLYPMTHGDDKYINISPATEYSIGGVIVRNGLSVDEKGFLDVSIGDTLYIDESGRIEVKEVPDKKKYSEGTGISITQDPEDEDNNIIMNTGILDVTESEEDNQIIVSTKDGDKVINITPSLDELPIANEDTLGGIKVGDGLEIDATGVLSATGGSKDLTVSAGEGINVQTKSFDPTAEYHRISYIRNNQDSYIIIPDYIANSSTRVVVEYAHNPGVYRSDGALFGAKSSSYGYSWYSYWRSGYDYFTGGFQYGSNSTALVNVSGYPQGTKMLLDVSTRGVYLNKELIQSVVEKGSLPAYPMSIFAASSTSAGTSTLYKPGAFTIYSFKIYEGEDLVKDLVPALNNEMVPGLWDLINGVFYGSANTNSFAYDSTSIDMDKGTYIVSSSPATLTTIGGIKPGEGLKVEDDGTLNISETIITEVDIDFKTDEGLLIHDVPDHGDIILPTGYKSISYIESRANAYTQVDYIPSSNTRISIDVSFKQGSGNFTNNAGAIIGDGSPSTDSVPKYTLWGHWTNSMTSPIIRLSNGTVNRDSVPGAELLNYYDHKRITFDIIPMDGLYADGEKIQDWEGGEFEPGTRQIQINRSSSYTTYGLRIYSIKIWDKGVLLLNLVPVLDPSNVSGLYDTIRKKFFKTLSSSNYLYDETSVDVITVEKTLTLLPATKTFIGGVRIGDGLSVTDDGTINVTGGGGGGYANIEVGNGLTMSGSSSITYEILDFVQTNGHQSVLTDLYPSLTKTTVEVKYEFLNISNDNVVFSTGRAFGSGELMYGILNTTGWHLCSALGMGSRYDFLETTVPTGIVEDTYTVIDRSSYGSTLTGTKPHSVTLANSSPIQLFKVNNWSTLASVKLYSMNVFNDDTLVGELVPARNKITKQVVIFNKLTNAVYPSNTSVSLIPGEPTGETIVVSTGQTQIIDVKLGNGLGFDANGAIEVTGSPPTPSDTNYVTDVTSKPNVSGVLQVTKEKPETSSEIDLYESFGILTINCVADEE